MRAPEPLTALRPEPASRGGARLLAGLALSLLLHGAAAAAAVVLFRGPVPAPPPTLIAVELVADPAPETLATEVAPEPEPSPSVADPAPVQREPEPSPMPRGSAPEPPEQSEPFRAAQETPGPVAPEVAESNAPEEPEVTEAESRVVREEPQLVSPATHPEPPRRKPALPTYAKLPPRAAPAPAVASAPRELPAMVKQPASSGAPVAAGFASDAAAQQAAVPHAEIEPPRALTGGAANPVPVYPLSARRRGQEGQVMLRVRVDPTGAPRSVQVLATSGHPALDREALRAVRRWRFEPARRGPVSVAGVVDVPVTFTLTER